MPKVWVVKEQVRSSDTGPRAMDYMPAQQYGDLEFITEFDLPLHFQSTVAGEWIKGVKNFLRQYDSLNDYIILTGSPLAIFLVGLVMGQQSESFQGSPKILVWRREQGRYIEFNPAHVFANI